ncbi:MAG: hypothetical protein AAF629_30315, partial [Chloroflexota bacterium]
DFLPPKFQAEAGAYLTLTLPEIRKLLYYFHLARPPDPDAFFAWSCWRRRHQYLAKIYHFKLRASPFSP